MSSPLIDGALQFVRWYIKLGAPDFLQRSNISFFFKPFERSSYRAIGSASDLPDRVLDASRRVEKALEHIGSDLNDILRLICLDMVGLERAEKKLGWPRRSGKLVLKIALNRLQKFYAGVEM